MAHFFFKTIKLLSGTRNYVYLDNNATTAVSKNVRRKMRQALKYYWGNPSSSHYSGKRASQLLENSRRHVAEAIHAYSHEVYFTGSATESNNTVIKSLYGHFSPGRKKIISSPVEHPSVINTLEFLKTKGAEVQYCPVDQAGRIEMHKLENMLDSNTFLICCVYANNETGTIQNIRDITALAKSKDVLVLSDCVQALGKIKVDVKELGVDYASFSAHKLYGPKGVGALYARISSPLKPFIHGGHQEEGIRAGTESVHNIAGFAAACSDIHKYLPAYEKTEKLKSYFISELKKIKADVVINSPLQGCLPNTISITFPGFSSQELMMMLDYYGIAVSSGSACSSQLNKTSHVLKAIGLTEKSASETLRISFGKDTSKSEIKYTLSILKKYLLHHVTEK